MLNVDNQKYILPLVYLIIISIGGSTEDHLFMTICLDRLQNWLIKQDEFIKTFDNIWKKVLKDSEKVPEVLKYLILQSSFEKLDEAHKFNCDYIFQLDQQQYCELIEDAKNVASDLSRFHFRLAEEQKISKLSHLMILFANHELAFRFEKSCPTLFNEDFFCSNETLFTFLEKRFKIERNKKEKDFKNSEDNNSNSSQTSKSLEHCNSGENKIDKCNNQRFGCEQSTF